MESEKAQEFAALAEKMAATYEQMDRDSIRVAVDFSQWCFNNRALILSALRSQSVYVDGWRAGREAAITRLDEYAAALRRDGEAISTKPRLSDWNRAMLVDEMKHRASAVEIAVQYVRALPLPEPNDGWRGIESAPKDGTPVLLTDGKERFVGEYHKNPWRDDQPWQIGVQNGSEPAFASDPQPTHWRPLPGPPIEEKL